MSPLDSGFPRDSGPKKRMLPSVTDVVRELAKAVSADPAVLFKAARSVVAEELAKVKQGFEAAPLDVLVKRARLQLERDGQAPGFSSSRASGVPAKPPAPDDPFQDVASRAELNWEKEIPIQLEDAPFRSAIIPIPHKARGPLEIFEDRHSTQPAMEAFRFKAAERPAPAPARPSRKGWLVALVSVLAIGAALTWAVREYVFRGEIVRSVASAARKKPDVALPASAAPVPAPTAAPALVAKPAAPSPKAIPVPTVQAAAGPPSGAAVSKGRAAALLTPDWAGKPVVYVIHFSSHKDRESATKEAQKLGAALGAPGHAVEVDLGEKGIWYRVVIGEFADVDAARAFRADLEAKKTPGMGFVYEMRGH